MGSSFLEKLLHIAVQSGGTDVHICPGIKPFLRINGQLDEVCSEKVVSSEDIELLIKDALTECQRERLEKNRVLDTSFSISGLGRFRSNIYSQRGSFAIAIRVLPHKIPGFESLGIPGQLRELINKTRGLILITGPAGSGKSTTIASLLNEINENRRKHIITIEDPIEYLHGHIKSLVTQREVGSDCDSFAAALISALREDPDVLMVGEMREPETISTVLTAAETGHLVLSTLHTIGAAKSIDRIIDVFPPGHHGQIRSQLATVLEGVISQQLIPSTDNNSRVLASEVMLVNPAVRNLIREGKHYQINSIMQTGKSEGMLLIEEDLVRLYREGRISYEEIFARCADKQMLMQLLNRRYDRG